MPGLEQRYAAYASEKMPSGLEARYSQFSSKKSQKQPSIYRKGGVYEQFGPNPPMFSPLPGGKAGFVQTGADQPGAALPFVGQAAGGYAGPMGGVAGALAGEGARQGLGRIMGVQQGADIKKQFGAAGRAAIEGELFGTGANQIMRGVSRMGESLKPQAVSKAIRSARNIIRPTGKLAKRGNRIAETSLKEGVLSSDKSKMMGKINKKLENFDQELADLIDKNQALGKEMTGERGIKRAQALERWYRRSGASDKADRVKAVTEDIIRGEKLNEPVMGEVKRLDTLGVSSKRTEQIGTKPRSFGVKEGQAKKTRQYEVLRKSKQGGGYGSETSSPEIETRQEMAGGFRRGLEKEIPEVGPLNRRFGDMVELGKAVKGREGVSSRNNFLDLGDIGMAAAGTINPKAWVALLARKLAQSGQGAAARGLYKFGKSGFTQAPKVSPAIRALIASQRREIYN